ncbi:ethanolamine kinase, putative [Leishmania donovani]|uniref:ethanolamine kinase n=1 Tax=Leishmania donovani TaxID=5661 RepID=A0A3Q8IPY5_LEIDO|nr:ethanolamine kinase, putative [Leishmania donovani]AYU80030.1 choline kinase [Leishmania donovani]TPP47508.1 Choline/ethanolamine kinase family protein [Leishmania donovani]CBZ35291.1 ethanolamine kinase, putative [Leishmania donovani]
MVQFTDMWITDDPLLRQIQIVEVVLTHCASVLWRHNEEKLKSAPEWAAKLRALLKTKAKRLGGDSSCRSPESCASQRSMTQQKKHNGLAAASADAIVYQKNSKEDYPPQNTPTPQLLSSQQSFQVPLSHKHATAGAALPGAIPTTQGGSVFSDEPHSATHTNLNTFSESSTCSSTSRLHYPEVGAGNNRVRHSPAGPLPSVTPDVLLSSCRSTEEHLEELGAPPTAATTRHNEVAAVRERSSPPIERSNTPELPSAPLQMKRLSGGITNELFHVYDEDDPSASVVVRVFGKETDRVISRESELFYQSLFIPTYVHGSNFLVYDYLDGYYTLPYQDMSAEAMPIARAIAAFQVRATRAALRDHGHPLLRDSQNKDYWKIVDNQMLAAEGSTTSSHDTYKDESRFDRESNYLIGSLTKWVDLVLSQEIVDRVREDKRESFLMTGRSLQSACAWMLSMLERQKAYLPEGVCHNDLLSANVMIHKVRKDVRVIDFDYTKRSFLLYDVANHFNEYPGLDCDYDTYFPSDAHMSAFIAEYRRGMRDALEAAWAENSSPTDCASREYEIFPNARELFWSDREEAEAQVVVHWTRLAKLLTLASHLSWSVWSLLQEAVSALDVDFLNYAQVRYNRYLAVRAECSENL